MYFLILKFLTAETNQQPVLDSGRTKAILCLLCLFVATALHSESSFVRVATKKTRRHHKPSGREGKSFLPRRAGVPPRKASTCNDGGSFQARREILSWDSRSRYRHRSQLQSCLSVLPN